MNDDKTKDLRDRNVESLHAGGAEYQANLRRTSRGTVRVRKFIGDLSDVERVLAGLDLIPQENPKGELSWCG